MKRIPAATRLSIAVASSEETNGLAITPPTIAIKPAMVK
jgi:hypothetical protein